MGKWRERFQQSTAQGASASPEATLPLPAVSKAGSRDTRRSGQVSFGPEPLPASGMAEAVEKVGRMIGWFSLHAHSWTEDVYAENRRKLANRLAQVEDGFRRYRTGPQDYGWAVSPDGAWSRAGEQVVSRELPDADTLIRDTLESAAALVAPVAYAGVWADPAIAALEEAMTLAREQADLPALRTAAESLLAVVKDRCEEAQAQTEAEERTLRANADAARAEQRRLLLACGLRLDWPCYPLPGRPGVYITAGERGWRTWAAANEALADGVIRAIEREQREPGETGA